MRGYFGPFMESTGTHGPVGGGRVVDFQPRPRNTDQPSSTADPIGFINRWHLTPWKRSNLLDVALSDDVSGASFTDVLNNIITQAGTVLTARNSPAGFVPRPAPGQLVPIPGSPAAASAAAAVTPGFLGLTRNQLLIGGLVVATGAFILLRRKRR